MFRDFLFFWGGVGGRGMLVLFWIWNFSRMKSMDYDLFVAGYMCYHCSAFSAHSLHWKLDTYISSLFFFGAAYLYIYPPQIPLICIAHISEARYI